ncbi:MAG: GIY-YIG nuclease family protein [Candidatus Paceibacterota bacterium]|jgi:predicted GIY-YIG superfamily endonuclease
MYSIYVIQNDVSYKKYIGVTNDLKRRINEHNHHSGSKYTNHSKGKWILIYAEAYRSKHDAYVRERRLKSHGSGKLELLKRLKNSQLETKNGEG